MSTVDGNRLLVPRVCVGQPLVTVSAYNVLSFARSFHERIYS